jgi:hypothetical protein
MHAIIGRVAYGDRDGARLKMQYLRNVIGVHNCSPIMSAMQESGDIRRVGNYIEGDHSFGYLPGQQYEGDKLRRFYPTDPRLLERLDAVHRQEEADSRRYRSPIHDEWEGWQKDLRIDTRRARKIIAEMPVRSNPYDIQTLLVERIRTRQHRFTVDAYGRVHNSITSLPRTLRQALRIHSQELGSVDIVNSQPALLAMLIHNTDHTHRWASHGHSLKGTAPSIYDDRFFPPEDGFSQYQKLATSGRLYEHLMDRTALSRREVKKGLLRDVFGKRGWYPSALEDAFRRSFPGPWRFVRRFNRDDHGALLKQLQRVESDLVIQQVGGRLAGNGPFISLHDSVFCRRGDLPVVESAFEHVTAAVGFRVKLRVA